MPRTAEQQALTTVTGVNGKVYPAATVAEIDEQLRFLSSQIAIAGAKAPRSCDWMRADQDRLLGRRGYLQLIDDTPADEAQA